MLDDQIIIFKSYPTLHTKLPKKSGQNPSNIFSLFLRNYMKASHRNIFSRLATYDNVRELIEDIFMKSKSREKFQIKTNAML